MTNWGGSFYSRQIADDTRISKFTVRVFAASGVLTRETIPIDLLETLGILFPKITDVEINEIAATSSLSEEILLCAVNIWSLFQRKNIFIDNDHSNG